MKLYEVKPGTTIDISHLDIYDGDNDQHITELFFEKLDGAYSICYYGEKVLHLGASTEVNVKED